MNIKTEFTRLECERFRRDCNFTPDELAVFNMRVQACSNVEIAQALNMSESTVTRRLKSVKKKIMKII